MAGDFNGDGVSDLAWAYQWTSRLRVYASLATVPADAGQVASIRQRLGADIVIDYARLRIPEQSDHRFRRKNYTAVSEDYDRTRVPIGIEIILGCLASGGCPLASLRLLDAGCGTGNYAAELRGYVGAIWNQSDGVRPYGFSAW